MDSIIWVKNLKQRSMQFNVSSMEVLNGHVYGYTPISEFALRIVLMISCLQSRLLCQLIAVNKKRPQGRKSKAFTFLFSPRLWTTSNPTEWSSGRQQLHLYVTCDVFLQYGLLIGRCRECHVSARRLGHGNSHLPRYCHRSYFLNVQ